MILGLTKRIIVVDAETSSKVELKKHGAARYWTDPSTRVLMESFKELGSDHCFLWTPDNARALPKLLTDAAALPPEEVMFGAFNASFDYEANERIGVHTRKEQWIDLMMLAYMLSFAGGLDDVLQQFDVRDQYGRPLRKNPDGKRLITTFSKQQTPWYDNPDGWHRFCNYCIDDSTVEVELLKKCLAVLDKPVFHPQIRDLHRQWLLNQRINARGMPVSLTTVNGALAIKGAEIKRLLERTKTLTGLDNPNSVSQLLAWCSTRGYPMNNLQAENVRDAIADPAVPEDVKEVLTCRLLAGKSSVKKFDAMAAMHVDGRIHNGYTLLGASRSGRDASRGLNLANIERGKLKNPSFAADLAEGGDARAFGIWLDGKDAEMQPMEVLGSIVRSAIAAPPGQGITVADLKSIESVGLAWLSGCRSILELFKSGKDTYKDFGTRYYKIAYDEVTKAQRQYCKPAVLGCLGRNTRVITNRGVVLITKVLPTDLLWDGVEWVTHEGVMFQGCKPVLSRFGETMTPDHLVLSRGAWTPWEGLIKDGFAGAVTRPAGLPQGFDVPPSQHRSYGFAASEEDTYDILNSGPRNRFAILTDAGPIIVHNCGYGASGSALVRYAKGMGVVLTEKDADTMVNVFRSSFAEIPLLWSNLEKAAKDAVRNPGKPFYAFACDTFSPYKARFHTYKAYPYVTYYYDPVAEFLLCGLPSGRTMFYYRPEILTQQRKSKKAGEDGSDQYYMADSIYYWGKQQDAGGAWAFISAWGGKLAENVTQAFCRDILYHGLELIDKDPLIELIGSTYDESINLTRLDDATAYDRVVQYMTTKPPYLDEDFFLAADGYHNSPRYKKD